MNTELTNIGLGKLGAALEAMIVDQLPPDGDKRKEVRTLVTVWLGTMRAEYLKKKSWSETVRRALVMAIERHARHKELAGFDQAAALALLEPQLVASVKEFGLQKEIERETAVKA